MYQGRGEGLDSGHAKVSRLLRYRGAVSVDSCSLNHVLMLASLLTLGSGQAGTSSLPACDRRQMRQGLS